MIESVASMNVKGYCWSALLLNPCSLERFPMTESMCGPARPRRSRHRRRRRNPQLISTVMDGTVAVVTMQTAPYNLLDAELNLALVEAFAWAQRQGARAAVLRSSLRHFCAGADLDQMLAAGRGQRHSQLELAGRAQGGSPRSRPPIVASVHGVCVGGGFELGALAFGSGRSRPRRPRSGRSSRRWVCIRLMGGIQRITQARGGSASEGDGDARPPL